ncbi:MAG: RNA methyltransferase [Candidatus Marinimicrobia bacterium]|nr:RNA methyltransferase [Candidatus Neomarinimicrobiota bacterium]MCF7840456.1 RNA methyltransferase [Candidatus Neomarinimicrobiota bacterium]
MKHLRSLSQKKFREISGEFLMEGVRLCEEALDSPLALTWFIHTQAHKDHPLVKKAHQRGLSVFRATQLQFSQFCDSKSPQGVAVVAKIPAPSKPPVPTQVKIVLALDRLADPGNVGTILRSARWFGVTEVVLSADCVDVYNPKVVRSSMGAIGYLHLYLGPDLEAFARQWLEQNGQVAVLSMAGEDLSDYQPPDGGLLLITGSEAHGVSAAVERLGTGLTIQRHGSGESLNAAMTTSIALWHLTR